MHRAKRRCLAERTGKIPSSGIRLIFEKAQKMSGVIRLDVGEPYFDTPEHIKAAAKEALDEGFTHYTSSFGMPELRETVSEKLGRDNGITVNPDNEIVITVGACSALQLAILATIDIGDEVLIPDPGWPHYEPCITIAGGRTVYYQLTNVKGFRIDVESIRKKITERTKMILINSPHNPTGAVISREDLKEIAEISERYNLLIISDEVYEKIIYDGIKHFSIASLPGMEERTITVNGFSKTYAMTGWRLGYAAGPKEIIEEMAKLALYTNACPNSISQIAGLAALNGPQTCVNEMVKEYAKRRKHLVEGLNEIEGFSCQFPEGAFYLFLNISPLRLPSWEATLFLLENAKVTTVPGISFGRNGEGYIRLSYSNSVENIIEAVKRIGEAIKKD